MKRIPLLLQAAALILFPLLAGCGSNPSAPEDTMGSGGWGELVNGGSDRFGDTFVPGRTDHGHSAATATVMFIARGSRSMEVRYAPATLEIRRIEVRMEGATWTRIALPGSPIAGLTARLDRDALVLDFAGVSVPGTLGTPDHLFLDGDLQLDR